ncbi:MAG TPA: LamG domain-containing protein, partial [Polyangiaceae bacterium]
TDSSGNNNDATLVGFSQPEPGTAPAPLGQALVFPATAQAYVEVPVLSLNAATGGANSISLWFYREASNVDDVLTLLPNSPRYDLWLTTRSVDEAGTDTYLCINTGHGDCFGVANATLLGRWVHVVAVFANGPIDGGTLYIDGLEQVSACLTSAGFASCDATGAAASPVDFGGATDFFYHGMMAELRVYDRALTASEVAALYSGAACP